MANPSDLPQELLRIASDLPQELVTEILVRLPVKSLLRFKCVCKDWFTMISDPLFAKAQLQQFKPMHGLICKSSKPGIFSYFNLQKGGEKEIDFKVDELLWNTVLRHSCNGLLLLQEHKFDHQFYVCNPIIQWHLKLPKFHLRYKIDSWSSVLVYDNSNHKYKVVITFCDTVSYKCGVFTLGDKEGGGDGNSCGFWRVLNMPADYWLAYCEPLSVNGALHWMAYKKSEEERRKVDTYVLLMDIASEEFREIKSPLRPTIWWLLDLLVIKGSLCVFCPVSFDQVDLWVLSDTLKQSWNKQFSINYRLLISESHPNPNLVFHPLVVMENPSPVIIFFCYLMEELIFYNLDTGESKVEHKGICISRSSRATVYVNSLIRC